MSSAGFSVDTEALPVAAAEVRDLVAEGAVTGEAPAWGAGFGHDGLTARLVTFVEDVDIAVRRLGSRGTALADALVDQAEAYEEVEQRAQDRVSGSSPAPTVAPGGSAPFGLEPGVLGPATPVPTPLGAP